MRDAAVYVVALFMPLAFAASIWPRWSGALRRTGELLVVVIGSKFVIVSIIALAAGLDLRRRRRRRAHPRRLGADAAGLLRALRALPPRPLRRGRDGRRLRPALGGRGRRRDRGARQRRPDRRGHGAAATGPSPRSGASSAGGGGGAGKADRAARERRARAPAVPEARPPRRAVPEAAPRRCRRRGRAPARQAAPGRPAAAPPRRRRRPPWPPRRLRDRRRRAPRRHRRRPQAAGAGGGGVGGVPAESGRADVPTGSDRRRRPPRPRRRDSRRPSRGPRRRPPAEAPPRPPRRSPRSRRGGAAMSARHYRFGPLEQRAIVGTAAGRAARRPRGRGGGGPRALLRARRLPRPRSARSPALGAGGAAISFPLGGRTAEEWAPVALRVARLAARGRRPYRSARPRGRDAGRRARSTYVLVAAAGARRDRAARLPLRRRGGRRDPRARAPAPTPRRSRCGPAPSPCATRPSRSARSRPGAACSRAARARARPCGGCSGSSAPCPGQGDELASYLQEKRDRSVPLDSSPVSSYIELVEAAAPVTQEHEVLICLQIDARRGAARRSGSAAGLRAPASS